VENYRPISILPAVAKVFECLVRDIMFNQLKNIIIPQQHGFFPGRSTATNLMEFIGFTIESFEDGLQVDVVFTDFKKAFDRISHEILLSKLHLIGVHHRLLLWIKSYLFDRVQLVKLRWVCFGYI
jgi:sarcosine oxidase/L-pipecolate oxidase